MIEKYRLNEEKLFGQIQKRKDVTVPTDTYRHMTL
jgi:hypothetical protein